jgi:hypothetical protein
MPATEAMLTMRPHFLGSISRAACWAQSKVPVTLTFIVATKLSSGKSRNGDHLAMPCAVDEHIAAAERAHLSKAAAIDSPAPTSRRARWPAAGLAICRAVASPPRLGRPRAPDGRGRQAGEHSAPMPFAPPVTKRDACFGGRSCWTVKEV